MNRLIKLILSLLAVASLPAQAAWLKLTLLPQVEVDGPRISLSDVTSCEAVLESQCRQLATIDLGAAAELAASISLSREDIAAAIAVEYPGKDLALDGPKFVRVKTRFQHPDLQIIQSYIREYLSNNFKDPDFKVLIEQIALINSNQPLPVGTGQYKSQELEANSQSGMDWFVEKILKPRQLTVEYVDAAEGGRSVSLNLRFKAKLQRKIPVASRNITRGARLGTNDVTDAWVDWEQMQRTLLGVRDIIGQDLKRNIRVGQAFTPEHLSQPKLVKRGQKIKVRFERSGLSITGDARVLSDAKLNETVELEMLTTKKKISGAVVSSDLAVVRSL